MMTEDQFQEYMHSLQDEPVEVNGRKFYEPRPKVVCADGFEVSIQANRFAYCRPREDGLRRYSQWELGFPTDKPTDEVMEHVEEEDDPTNTVYGHVPTEKIIRLLSEHGGILALSEVREG